MEIIMPDNRVMNDTDTTIEELRAEIDQLHKEAEIVIEQLEELTNTLRIKHTMLEAMLEVN
jgi:uncharacterized coiled-coil DUF342 family protein